MKHTLLILTTALCGCGTSAGPGYDLPGNANAGQADADASAPLEPEWESVAGVWLVRDGTPLVLTGEYPSATPGEWVTLEGVPGGPGVRVFLYGRAGEREGYGVYGLWREKSKMDVAWPLDAESIHWDGVDARSGLQRLLGIVAAPDSDAFLDSEAPWLWAEGARAVFLVAAPWEDSDRGRSGPLLYALPLR